MTHNLDPLVAQVQRWWMDQHAGCERMSADPLGRPFEGYAWLYSQEDLPVICGLGCGWSGGRTRDQLVLSLRPRLKAGAVETAGLLEQPDAQVARQVASALVPQPFGYELAIVTDLIEAAGAQTIRGRNRTLAGAGFSTLLLLGFFFFRQQG
jgi:hypothetical protein